MASFKVKIFSPVHTTIRNLLVTPLQENKEKAQFLRELSPFYEYNSFGQKSINTYSKQCHRLYLCSILEIFVYLDLEDMWATLDVKALYSETK